MTEIISSEERTIETEYHNRRTGGYYKNQVLEATADENGNVTFDYACGEHAEPSAKTNIIHRVTYKLRAGAVDGEVFGLDWDKVNTVSGKTYDIRQEIKNTGLFKWDGASKRWVRK